MAGPRWRVVVCGTKFGRVYLSALAAPELDMELVGIVAAGSERSIRCAERFGVPLFTNVEQLPEHVDAACVAISSEIGGGPGTDIALRLLERRISVLQEHPLHHDELAKLLATARRSGAVHRVNTLYPYTRSVRQFLAAGRLLLRDHLPIYLDGACSIQFKTSFFDIVGRLLARLRPWEFWMLPRGRERPDSPLPFRSIQGVIGGVPITVRLQNQLHGMDPDNHAHVYHHLTVGFSVGSLTLVDTHGPIVWRPRPHIPVAVRNGESPEICADPALDNATASVIGEANTTWRAAMVTEWPAAVGRALTELRLTARGQRVAPDAQYYLSLLQMVHDFSLVVGPPEVVSTETPVPQSAATLRAAVAAVS